MSTNITCPKIVSVSPRADKMLFVEFEGGVQKVYDCKPLLSQEVFQPLVDEVLFRCAQADPFGYAVIWSDEIDLAESEVWLNGTLVGE